MNKIIAIAAGLLCAGAANASIIPTLTGNPVDVGGGSFRYTYSATLASDQALVADSFFTLYDIVGFTGFGNVPEFFTPSSQLLGRTPPNVLPRDDAALFNASFTYTGPTVNFDGPFSERELGTFEIFSTVGTFGFDDFTSEAIRNDGPSRGSLVATIGLDAIAVPGGGGGAAVIPEPATWGLMIAGFGLVGLSLRRRTTRVYN